MDGRASLEAFTAPDGGRSPPQVRERNRASFKGYPLISLGRRRNCLGAELKMEPEHTIAHGKGGSWPRASGGRGSNPEVWLRAGHRAHRGADTASTDQRV